MNRKSRYAIFAALIIIGVYAFEFYLNEEEQLHIETEGREVKKDTNTFFLPTSTTGQIVHHEGYSLSYHEMYEQAEWVAYELKKAHLSKAYYKRPYFEIDKAVKTGAAHWKNYKKSGFDKGHLCPAADRLYNKSAHDETFLTSNISPQNHDFNAGIWNALEQKVRYWANIYDGVFVVTGGILMPNLKTIGEEGVAVPKQFYKVVLDMNGGKPKILAFLIPHKNSNSPLDAFIVSVDSIEQLTKIDFFPELEDALETKLEASTHPGNWKF